MKSKKNVMYVVLVSLAFIVSLATITIAVLALLAVKGMEMLATVWFALLCLTTGLGVVTLVMWFILWTYRTKKGM